MWLLYVETYLFVLVAFTAGVVVGLVGVRIGVRRLAPARVPQPKAAKQPKAEKRRGRKGAEVADEPAAEVAPSTGGGA